MQSSPINEMAQAALSLVIVLVATSVTRVRSNSCEEVWFEDAAFDGEPYTCGERIVFLQTPQGGLLTEQEARVKTALENDLCADCWPWEKYREDGETERSAKRGIAIENHLLTAEMLSGLSHIVSWGATWDYKLQGGPSLEVWQAAGVEFYPMIWGSGTLESAQKDGLPEGSRALLGFNEPNFPDQANLHPYWAAYYWKDLERLAEENNITTLVAPSMNYHWSFDPIDWLYQFFYHCADCKVDAISLHVFSCYANGLKYHLDRYRVFGKPMWVTEIACSDPASPERLSAEGQMAYMQEAIPLLEADEDVEMYAWFSYFKDEWDHPIVDGENGDAGLIHPNGTLTNLGKLFSSFAAGSNLTEINITIPEWKNETNELSSTTAESEALATTKSATTTVSETATSSTTGSETWSSTRTGSTTTVTSSVTATSTQTSTQTGSSTTISSSRTGTTTRTDTSTTLTTTSSSSSSTGTSTRTSSQTGSSTTVSSSRTGTTTQTDTSTTLTTTSSSSSSTGTSTRTSTRTGSSTTVSSSRTGTTTRTDTSTTLTTTSSSSSSTGTSTRTSSQTGSSTTVSSSRTGTTTQTDTSTTLTTTSSSSSSTGTSTRTSTQTGSSTTVSSSRTGTTTRTDTSTTLTTTSSSSSSTGTSTRTSSQTGSSTTVSSSRTGTTTQTDSSTTLTTTSSSSSSTGTSTRTSTQTGSSTTVSSSRTGTTTRTDTSTTLTTTGSSSSSTTQSSSATSITRTSSTKTWSGVTSSTTTVTLTETSATSTISTTLSMTETSVTATETETSTGSTTLSTTETSVTATETATSTDSTTLSTTETSATSTGSTTRTATSPPEPATTELTVASNATETGTTTLSSTYWAMLATSKTQTTTRTLTTTLTSTLSTSATRTATLASETWTATSTSGSIDSANTTTEPAYTNYTSSRHLTGTAPSTTVTQGGESTTYTLEEENATNDTELTCGEAVEAWCQNDPEGAPFIPLRHCSDWRLHDTMCTSRAGGQGGSSFKASTTLQQASLSVAFLVMAVIGAAMLSAAITSAYHRKSCLWLRYLLAALCLGFCCRRREEEEQEEELKRALKRAVSEKDWPGRCLNIMGNARVAPGPGVLLPVEAVGRRLASSPMAGEVVGTLSRKSANSEVTVGTPVGTTPASRAAALNRLQEAMAKATDEDTTWDEKQIALDQVGRLLAGAAVTNLPMALRQEAEAWQSRQDERLRLARSLGAAAQRAAVLEDGAREAMAQDGADENPLRELMARAKLSVGAGDREAMLAEAARRASAFQEELDAQRLRLQARRRKEGKSALLTTGALLDERDALSELKDKVAAEFATLPGLREDSNDEAWDSACDALEDAWKQLSADVESAAQEAQSELTETLAAAPGSKVTKSLEATDAERRAALAEAARRAAAFDEELQKQRQKLQKRAKGKGNPTPALELGRLLEDREAFQVLEAERAAALEKCQEFLTQEGRKLSESEANDWAQLVEALDAAKTDLDELGQEAVAETLAGTWADIATKLKTKLKTGKLQMQEDSRDEHLAMLGEAARRAAAFDEELQKQRSQMKKRRKALQKGSPDHDPLEACRSLADEQMLKKLAKEQAEACAQCEASAASAEGDAKEAWAELGAAWAAMSKDMAKAEKEARESAKVVVGDAASGLGEALGLVGEATENAELAGGCAKRLVEDDGDARRAALQEAARRVATFDEELAKQRAAMRRRRTDASVPAVLGHALRDGASLRGLAEATSEQRTACEAAIQAAREEGGAGADAWEDLAKVLGRLQEDVAEAAKEAEADAEEACGDVAEVSQHLAFRGLGAAARRLAAFERKLPMLRREGRERAAQAADELRDGFRAKQLQELRDELAEGTRECQAGMQEVPDAIGPLAAESRSAWQELLSLWRDLAADLESLAEGSPASLSTSATSLRRAFDTSVDDAEKQTALALAARRALQFDEELQRQRQRLVRRTKATKSPKEASETPEPSEPGPTERLRALGDAVALQALASDGEAAAAGCREALAKAEVEQKWDEVQGWKQILQVYESGQAPLQETMQEVEAAGGLSSQAKRAAGHRLVQQVARDQKQGAEACLKAVEKALNTDSGPLEELIEAQQLQTRSVKSNGGSTRRSRGAEVAAQVQMWDVLEEAQGLLNVLKKGGGGVQGQASCSSAEAMQVLKQLGDEAARQLDAISTTHEKETKAKETKAKEKLEQRDAGCQTIFRLGGMAWHSNPAVQKLLEELMKVSTQGPTADPDQVDKLDDEVTAIMEKWQKTFIERNRQRGNNIRRQEPPPDACALPPAQAPTVSPSAPQAPPVMLEADMVDGAAVKKLEERLEAPAPWIGLKRDEVKVTVEASSFQTSTFDNNLPGLMPEPEDASGVPVPVTGRIPHSSEHRRPRAGSEDAQQIPHMSEHRRPRTGSEDAQGQRSEPVASRSRRRRSLESSKLQCEGSASSGCPDWSWQPFCFLGRYLR